MEITVEDWLRLEARLAALELAIVAIAATHSGADPLASLKEVGRSSEDVSARVDQRLAALQLRVEGALAELVDQAQLHRSRKET
jgi:hypothetical protein